MLHFRGAARRAISVRRSQDARLLDHASKIRDRLFVDNRWLGLARLPDLRQVAAGQDCQETEGHPRGVLPENQEVGAIAAGAGATTAGAVAGSARSLSVAR